MMKREICLLVFLVMIIAVAVALLLERPVDYDCSNFKSYAEALRIFKKNDKDVYHLDGDHDGIPCETLIYK